MRGLGLTREDLRKSVHLAMTGFALLLRWLEPWQAVVLAGAAILLNWVILPLSGLDRRVGRDGEHYVSGVKLYPVGVLLAVLLFPLPVAAAAWAALGVGDYASNVIGRRMGRRKLPWNEEKSWAGAIAFVVATLPAAAFLLWFTWANWSHGAPPPLDRSRLGFAALAVALVGAILETLAIPRVNDNVLVPVGAGLAALLVLVA
jgi:dolichol kinase